jgi:hypothetical protein
MVRPVLAPAPLALTQELLALALERPVFPVLI